MRKPSNEPLPPIETFEPADYSMQELSFLLTNLRKTPNVALHDAPPKGVNPTQVRRALSAFHDLQELADVKKQPWAGFAAVEDSITRFIKWQEKCLAIQARGGPRHPSQHNWDSTGAMSSGGIGSDSSEKVRHEINDDGDRVPFTVNLRDVNRKAVDMPWTTKAKRKVAPVSDADVVTHTPGVYACSICDKPVASYDTVSGRKGQNKARTAARKHLKTCRTEVSRHRAIANVPIE